jgi:hypothetical protein
MFLIFESIKVKSHFLHASSFIKADRIIFFLNFICFHSSLDYLAASSFAILMYFDLICLSSNVEKHDECDLKTLVILSAIVSDTQVISELIVIYILL